MDTTQTQTGGVTDSKGGSSSLAIIIVILIIALGGAFFWYSRVTNQTKMQENLKAQEPVADDTLQKDLEVSGGVDVSADMAGLDEVYK